MLYVHKADDVSPCCIQLLLAQDKRVDQLEEKLKLQQDKLEKQSLQLQALQNKVSRTTSTNSPVPQHLRR